MHPEVAQVIAERALRRQHVRQTWNRSDQCDYARWNRHDNEHHEAQGLGAYAVCGQCFPEAQ